MRKKQILARVYWNPNLKKNVDNHAFFRDNKATIILKKKL